MAIARAAAPKDNDERQEFLTLVAAYARRS
jgi:hypothetical protein